MAGRASIPLAPTFGGPIVRRLLLLLATVYLAVLLLDGMGARWPRAVIGAPLHYFAEISGLFPDAATASIDYRAEGWRCDSTAWEEIDTRRTFTLRPDDKENRFYRYMYFYRRSPEAMRAMEAFFLERSRTDGRPLGGVRLLSLRIPFPPPGAPAPRYVRRPLDAFPPDERKVWFETTSDARSARCGAAP